MTETRYISCADTAKFVRAALKQSFPLVAFSVRSKVYSGGASITIHYIDGPTTKEVDALISQYKGASFDPMIDLKSAVYRNVNSERVNYGSDYIHCERSYSATFLAKIAAQVVAAWGGFDVPEIKISRYDGSGYFVDVWNPDVNQRTGGYSIAQLIMQTVYKTSAV